MYKYFSSKANIKNLVGNNILPKFGKEHIKKLLKATLQMLYSTFKLHIVEKGSVVDSGSVLQGKLLTRCYKSRYPSTQQFYDCLNQFVNQFYQ